ncbi:hypothetical protein [Octadecabacter ascidiaceicola]|uniref:Uncharacterized protein n=1 Tax=Octadecabacter ascidiaceicola TaxID=1655543 RepID=A0A238JUZ2_9RHOB|nr:hypothetical protein [Octadecabacter ascidiaceicola]SMX33632.1 hypothetical protein OCA8868_00990 [Octadecabacter ascidiaceicola]
MDERKLTPANENPWYILMTLYGEQEGARIDKELAEKNRDAWNKWFCRFRTLDEFKSLAAGMHTAFEKAEMLPSEGNKFDAYVEQEFQRRSPDGSIQPNRSGPILPFFLGLGLRTRFRLR